MSQWWIKEPVLLGSSNPTESELKDLYHSGFRTIISLLDEEQHLPYCDARKLEEIGFTRYSVPVRDFTAPTLADFKKFLEVVRDSLGRGKVIVHCQEGIGRTGTMAAAYWIKEGLSAKKAVEKIRNSRPGAIEMPEQEESLYDFEALLAEDILRVGRKD